MNFLNLQSFSFEKSQQQNRHARSRSHHVVLSVFQTHLNIVKSIWHVLHEKKTSKQGEENLNKVSTCLAYEALHFPVAAARAMFT